MSSILFFNILLALQSWKSTYFAGSRAEVAWPKHMEAVCFPGRKPHQWHSKEQRMVMFGISLTAGIARTISIYTFISKYQSSVP